MSKRGIFITLEGIEGSGKTTQVPVLTEIFHARGYDCVVTREPGGNELAYKIREILLDPENKGLVPRAELLLYLADRAQHVDQTIEPALTEGKAVICDRYSDATFAYQSFARGLPLDRVTTLNDFAAGGLKPDLTLLFDLPVKVGLARAQKRVDQLDMWQPTEDRFEQLALEFHEKVRDGYLTLADREPERYIIIDADQNREAVSAMIRDVVGQRLDRTDTVHIG